MGQLTNWIDSIGIRAWMIDVFIIVLATLVLGLAARVILSRLQDRLSRTRTRWDQAFVEAVARPLQVLIWIVGLAFAAETPGRDGSAIY